MPGCNLHVTGDGFDVEAFLANSPFEPYDVFRRGEFKGRKNHKRQDCSGFSLEVSKVYGDLGKQCEEVTVFLQEYHGEMSRLRAFPGVTEVWLHFGYERREVAVQSEWLPPELLVLVGSLGLGIQLSLYPNGQQMDEIAAKWEGHSKIWRGQVEA